MYINGWMKWSSMVDWKASNKGGAYPKFNPENPEINKEWRTPQEHVEECELLKWYSEGEGEDSGDDDDNSATTAAVDG